MLHKNKITLYAFVLFLFGFILLTLSSILQAQTNAGEKVGDELTINGSRYWTGHYTDKQITDSSGLVREKLSEFEKDVSTEFTKLTEDGIQKTSKIDEIEQQLKNIFRDGSTRSDEIDALQERIKMLEDRLAKENGKAHEIRPDMSQRPLEPRGHIKPNQPPNENPQGFSSGEIYEEEPYNDPYDPKKCTGQDGYTIVDC